ncbi:MAG: C25 family cysteine peptidase, partial [Candidatus Omnitrophica bacterium]|nr:C25 family cysteine peptidase [Candidatus Omnitrophota bacterium]
MRFSYYALFEQPHHVITRINSKLIEEAYWTGEREYIFEKNISQEDLSSLITVEIEPLLDENEYDLILPNYFEIEYWRNLKAKDNYLDFSYIADTNETVEFILKGFTTEQLNLFDITQPLDIRSIRGFEVVREEDNTFTLRFRQEFNVLEKRRFLVLIKDNLLVPSKIECKIQSSSLTDTNQQADYLIITHQNFKEALLPLAKHYEKKGLKVKIISVDDIYDQFSYGRKSPYAIKDFLRYTYKHWKKPAPTYVLLVGDSHYDYRNYLGSNKINYLPAYLVPNVKYVGETAGDHWFVCLD